MTDKFKVKISSFVVNILENDALRFGFTKNNKSNKNALLNKLILTLVEVRKARRNEIEYVLKEEYRREDEARKKQKQAIASYYANKKSTTKKGK